PGHRRPGGRGGPLGRHPQRLHARRGPRSGQVRRRDRPPVRWPGVHPGHRPAGRVRRRGLPQGTERPPL
ncbi:MAG: FIG019045: long form Mg-chelase associated protein with vWA domain, partial [uncultured Nocardioidaceae bacterium]